MNQYHAKASKSMRLELRREESLIGQLVYTNWFKYTANVELADGTSYTFEPRGFWGTTIEVKRNDEVLARMKMNWNGEIVIETSFGGHLDDFIFKQVGIFKGTLVLRSKEGEELIVVNPVMEWGSISHEYRLTTTDKFETHRYRDIILMIALHCANYFTTLGASAATG